MDGIHLLKLLLYILFGMLSLYGILKLTVILLDWKIDRLKQQEHKAGEEKKE